jgi:hypothetical protein
LADAVHSRRITSAPWWSRIVAKKRFIVIWF